MKNLSKVVAAMLLACAASAWGGQPSDDSTKKSLTQDRDLSHLFADILAPKPLGRLGRWRYESCKARAAQAPTEKGVFVGLGICRRKFGQ